MKKDNNNNNNNNHNNDDDKDVEYVTEEKRKELKAELEELRGNKRKKIIEKIEYAKSLGDLSENAEYQQAREDQAKLEDRIAQIRHILRTAKVVKKKHHNIVEVGSTVTIKKESDKEKKIFHIVGSEEADMSQEKISNKSPLGIALFGKKKGDRAEVETPKGIVKYKILDIK